LSWTTQFNSSEAFPGQKGYIIPPASSGSAPGSPSSRTCLKNLQREATRRHPNQMPKPPQLTLFRCRGAVLPHYSWRSPNGELPQCKLKVMAWEKQTEPHHPEKSRDATLRFPNYTSWDPIHRNHKRDRWHRASVAEDNTHCKWVRLSAKDADTALVLVILGPDSS